MTADASAGLIPQEVIDLMVERQFSPVKAWRIYRKLSQSKMAQALGVTQSAFSQIERSRKCQRETLEKVAAILGIRVQALDLLPS